MPFWILITGAAAMALVQDIFPGQDLYHRGWYNALAAALLIAGAMRARKAAGAGRLALMGSAMMVLAGVSAGLLGPDTQTIVGAPGATVQNQDFGAVSFPLESPRMRRSYTLSTIVWPLPRTVVHVDAADMNGNHLTMTQPTNATFLSPVLLMQQTGVIAEKNVRVDSFAVPAARRDVKAVLFEQPVRGKQLLFAVSDANDRPVRGGITLAASGELVAAGGLQLRGTLEEYPALVVAAAPFLPVLAGGLLLFAIAAARSSSRSRT